MATNPEDTKPRRRRALPIILIVVATLIGIVSVMALWVKRQALETETWTRTSSELLENESIRDAVGDFMVTALFENVDVQSEIADKLPPQAEALAGPAAAGLRELAGRAADQALANPKTQALWEDANRVAHQKLVALLEDKGDYVSTTGGEVTLDLKSLITELASDIGLPSSLVDKLPESASSIEIMKSDELSAAQSAVQLLKTLAWVLVVVVLLLYGLAIYLARDRRRETLRAVGFSFLAVGVIALIARNAGGNAVSSALTSTAAAEDPVRAAWEIGTSLLKESGQSLIVYGIVIVLAAWLAGPSSWATSIRHALTPYLRRPAVAYGGLAVLLALLFWWDPLVSTHRLPTSILLIVLLAIGVEALRRQVIREFPDHVTARSPAGVAQAMAGRMREAREKRVSRSAAAAPSGDPKIDQLEKLAGLHESGVLSDEELAAEKARILSG